MSEEREMPALTTDATRYLLDLLAGMLLTIALLSVLVRRLDYAIFMLAGQGVLLAGAAGVVAVTGGELHAYIAAAATLAVKGVGIPWVLFYALRTVRLKREVDIVVPNKLALPIAAALVLVAYDVIGRLGPLDDYGTRHVLPAAVGMLFIGLFTMLVRKKAISQVISLVSMENGVYLAAVVALGGFPLTVELGIALDLLMGAVVMGMVIREISRTFATINTDRLGTLKG
jgi:hydrogenase-4 component E